MKDIYTSLHLKISTKGLFTTLFLLLFGVGAQAKMTVDSCDVLACNDQISFSVVEGNSYPVNVDAFLEGFYCKSHSYKVEYKDGSGVWKLLTQINELLPVNFEYRVTDLNTGNFCWGNSNIKVIPCNDPFTPVVKDRTIDLNCTDLFDLEHVGLPIPGNATYQYDSLSGFYYVFNWGPCEVVRMQYADRVIEYSCMDKIMRSIVRTYRFFKKDNTQFSSVDSLVQHHFSTSEYIPLKNFDGIEERKLNCNEDWYVPGMVHIPYTITGSPIQPGEQCPGVIATFDDQKFYVNDPPCVETEKVLRTWKVINWCTGQVDEFRQIIKLVCSNDTLPPIPICKNAVFVNLRPNGTARLYTSDVDGGSWDDCGIARISFDENTAMDFIEFNTQDAGKTYARSLFIEDYNGNKDKCIFSVKVLGSTLAEGNLGGQFLNYKLAPYQDLSIVPVLSYAFGDASSSQQVSECQIPATQTSLHYTVCADTPKLTSPYHLDIEAQKQSNPLFGISTLDYIIAQRLILSKKTPNPFIFIGADLNEDGSVSVSDLSLYRAYILGKKTPPANPWRFYAPDTQDIRTINEVDIDQLPYYDHDVVPVVIGDISDSRITGGLKGKNKTRSGADIYMSMENHYLVKDNVVDIAIKVESGEQYILGLQIGQIFRKNAFSVLSIEPIALDRSGGDWMAYDDQWRYLYVDRNLSPFIIKDHTEWLVVRVSPHVSGYLEDLVDLTTAPLDLRAITFDEQEVPIHFTIGSVPAGNKQVGEDSPIRVFPNPSTDVTTLDLSDLSVLNGDFHLYTLDGQLKFSMPLSALQNNLTIELNNDHFGGSGVFIGIVETITDTHIVRLVRK